MQKMRQTLEQQIERLVEISMSTIEELLIAELAG